MFGWDGVKFEGLLYYDGSAPIMALGLTIEKIPMNEIVEKMFQKKLTGITWLTELTVGRTTIFASIQFICILNAMPLMPVVFGMPLVVGVLPAKRCWKTQGAWFNSAYLARFSEIAACKVG